MKSLNTFFLIAFLPLSIASQIITMQDTFTIGSTVTETKTVILPSGPLIPPAGWSTTFITDLAAEVLVSTISGTITRTSNALSTLSADESWTCYTNAAGILDCEYYPSATASSDLGCEPVTSLYTITYAHTGSTCDCGHKSTTHISPSTLPTYSCDPLVNISCWSDLYTWTYPTPPHTTSTSFPVGTITDSASACEETPSQSTTSWAQSTQSNSPHIQSGSIISSSTTTFHTSGGYRPTATSSSPVTAGSMAMRPRSLAGLLSFMLAVMAGLA